MSEINHLLNGYKLATAEIIYHLPDYPEILQSYVWQEYDQLPDFPELKRFLDFWESNLEGKLHSVTVTNLEIINPSEVRSIQLPLNLH